MVESLLAAGKRAVEYLIARDAAGSGGEPTASSSDDQWNTYDEALHGVTSFMSGYYLAAPRGGRSVGAPGGRQRRRHAVSGHLQEGAREPRGTAGTASISSRSSTTISARKGEVGPGCMADQLIGQWWAHQLGLGYILPGSTFESAIRAGFHTTGSPILPAGSTVLAPSRGAGDKGLIICTWPGRPP